MANKKIKCAIYTRKSSEEGLEQEFNSLHAQREAAESYIKSQKHEGWEIIKKEYNDGGFSGGNTERPGLKALMQDIQSGLVDIVVVYKVDRLSRSLRDFAGLMDEFDKRQVSFVSVTQQFNTTTSMGRLTLNILLSFAQFEREVTGERIRDKIAASKKKGIWMGGWFPLGYDVVDRKLVVNKDEAKQVQMIFEKYLEIKSVYKLCDWLNAKGYKTKPWTTQTGKEVGGGKYHKNTLYKILTDQIYIGMVTQKKDAKSYEGQHEAILDRKLFDDVQAVLGHSFKRAKRNYRKTGMLLRGKCFDLNGNRFNNDYSVKNKSTRYYYYRNPVDNYSAKAEHLEGLITDALKLSSQNESLMDDLFQDMDISLLEAKRRWQHLWKCWDNMDAETRVNVMQTIVEKIIIVNKSVTTTCSRKSIKALIENYEPEGSGKFELFNKAMLSQTRLSNEHLEISANVSFIVRYGQKHIFDESGKPAKTIAKTKHDMALIKAIGKAYRYCEGLDSGEYKSVKDIAQQENLQDSYISRILRLRYLSPAILDRILNGTQPATLNLQQLIVAFPTSWKEQERLFL